MKYCRDIIHLQSKTKGENAMEEQNKSVKSTELLNEIIKNAIGLPLECLERVCSLTEGMAITNRIMKQNQPHKTA